MKKSIKRFVVALLHWKVRRLLPKEKDVIAITGSMGKTTTRKLITHLLEDSFPITTTKGGFNTPIGVCLNLLGEYESGFSYPCKWAKILTRALWRKQKISETIILEYGVDRKGDMDELTEILQPTTSIITNVAPVHLGDGLFQSIHEIADEKWKLAESVEGTGEVIINTENSHLAKKAERSEKNIIHLGNRKDANIQYKNISTEKNGTSFTYVHEKTEQRFFIPFFGEYIAQIASFAIYIALKKGMSTEAIQEKLKTFSPAPGRGKILKGKNNSYIWDSSYNSNPEAMESMLKTLEKIPSKRKIVVVGTMNELGEDAEKFHERIGEICGEHADLIYFVGEKFSFFEEGVKQSGKNAKYFTSSTKAGDGLKFDLHEGDFILVKGSQGGIFLEQAIEKIVENPDDEKLLCRRGAIWDAIREKK